MVAPLALAVVEDEFGDVIGQVSKDLLKNRLNYCYVH
jgi:hypothetical protein